MKKLTILTLLILMFLTWCSDNNSEVVEDNNNTNKKIEQVTKNEEIEINVENEVYSEIIEEKWSLKDATRENLDKIIQEEIKKMNIATSDYPFFKQATMQMWNFEEIKNAWWLEVTRWQIYLLWLEGDFSIFNNILSEKEKEYTFHKENWEFNFFYTELSKEELLKSIKNKIWWYKELFSDDNFIELEIQRNDVKYSVQIILSNKDFTPRDELDFILNVINQTKVIISSF